MRVCNATGSSPCDGAASLLASALRRRVSVSRMLEICMSGSMRGSSSPLLPTRLTSVFVQRTSGGVSRLERRGWDSR